MVETKLIIINKLGLHARAAAKLVATTTAYSAAITIRIGDKPVDGKSIMALMMLAASKGTEITVNCQGSDEDAAMAAVQDLINQRFGEGE
ncbi:MAG: HPr family phosphocarrier protein [Zhongshania sp.]|uniref:HPr family phosphocarrier protein n=1 Tax=Zhongshania sp. TaxID=1971902 RepID=UPI00260731DE|nr:HPr family phosphocarrier protein [Zhongshania sp.]MDF1693033.1 HPr family phosphocarrier protein [Zhongshania sp.]